MTFLSFVTKYLDALPEEVREQFLEDLEDVIEFAIRQAVAANASRGMK